jgi:hypothetical protein
MGMKVKLQLEWVRPMPLRDAGRDENLIYTFDHAKLPEAAGVTSGRCSHFCFCGTSRQFAAVQQVVGY